MKTSDIFHFGEFTVDPLSRSLSRNEDPITLNRRAFDVLLYFVQNPGRVVTKEELLKAVWPDAFVDENNLTQSISTLRKALDELPGSNTYITTLPGRGYQFTAAVRTPAPASAYLLQEQTVITSTTTSDYVATGKRPGHAVGWWAAAGLLALCSVYFGRTAWKARHPAATSASLVVGDFSNGTGDKTFDHTLRRAVEEDFEQSPYLSVMGEREGFSTLRKMEHPTDQPLTAELAQEVCERTNRQVVVNGDIAELGGRYLLTLDATDCHTGKVLAAAKTEATAKSDVLDALDYAADTVRRGLGESKQSIAEFQVPISQVTTPSIDALEAYSMGLYLSGQGRAEAEVMPFYKRAIELDPQFAMAYAKLADVYTNDDETALATQYYSKALTLSDHLSAREKMALQAQYADATDMQRGVAAYKMWAEMYPNDVLPEANLSDRYMQLGEFPAAIQTGERALALAPDNANEFDILARAYKRASQFDKAKAVVSQAVARGKDYVRLHDTLNEIAWAENDQPAMAREAQWADQKGTWFSFDLEGCIAADGGQLDRAEGYFEKAISTAERDHLNTTADEVRLDQAEAEILLGQLDRARTTLQRIAREDSDSAEFVLLNIKLGQLAPAEAFLKAHPTIESQPSDPLTYLNLPRIRAALALAHNRPLDAIAALDGVQQYDLSDSGLNAMSLRGKAYLLAHQPDQAAAQYKKILQNPGLPVTAELSLAHLGLAEAEEMRGNLPAADKEYSAFLARWTGADPHNVVVATAKTDLDALRRNEEEARR